MTRRAMWSLVFIVTLILSSATQLSAQSPQRSLIAGIIDDNQTLVLHGNVRPEVTDENDRGARDGGSTLSALLVLHRSDENEAAFKSYLDQLHTPGSPNFHQWLTNAQIGALYGPSPQDISRVSAWLTQKGFTAHPPSPDGSTMEFEGTVAQVSAAFHTSIHNLSVGGDSHYANVTDPEIPATLAPVVAGVASLNDFLPHTMSHRVAPAPADGSLPTGSRPTGSNFLGAADLATIYNFNPLFHAGITGKGQTIVLIEDTDQYSIGDWQVFRKVFGLSRAYPYATLTQVHPTGTTTCTAPGVNGDDSEAAIDVEWALAAAPNANIVNAACKATGGIFGGFVALSNMLQGPNPPQNRQHQLR